MRAAHRQTSCHSSERGFTLLEAFVVLVIIAILAIIAVPAIMNTLTHQKLATATNSFVNQVEFARVQAASRNRAYLVRVDLSNGNNSGAIHLDEGDGSACTPATFTADGSEPEPIADVRVIDFKEEGLSDVQIVSAQPALLVSAGVARFCVRPDGRVLSMQGTTIPAPEGYGAGEAVFRLQLFSKESKISEAEATNLAREVVVPYNGIPKVRNTTE
jgi:prepilin-type N-terminal cleavage/methylation domain-containing protein